MKIAVLGTGMVGSVLAQKLSDLGHDVVIGTRDPAITMREKDGQKPAIATLVGDRDDLRLLAFPEAGAYGELIVNATGGNVSLDALSAVGEENLRGKVLLDLAIPLDFGEGMPPRLSIVNDDSLGERIQRAFPSARVVKSLNTVFCEVMVDPSRIPGRHNVFVAGDDADAKEVVTHLLGELGWPEDWVLDLGGIETSRATEMYMRLYFTLVDQFGFLVGVEIKHP